MAEGETEGDAMPIHDWTRVTAGTWHAFHLGWIAEIQIALNDGRMPKAYYAQAEQITGPWEADVLALEIQDQDSGFHSFDRSGDSGGSLAIATSPPKTRFQSEMEFVNRKMRRIAIRHLSGDRIVALIELVSPGNKSNERSMRSFVENAVSALQTGYHLLIVDLFPSTSRDLGGIHSEISSAMGVNAELTGVDEPLTLAAYASGASIRAYVEPTSIGRELTEMPLFLTPEKYINVPLEETYTAAYRGVPQRWKTVLDP